MKKLILFAFTALVHLSSAEAQLKMNPAGNVVVGSLTADPAYNLEVRGDSYVSCYPALSGFYFTNESTAGVIKPQWNHSAYLGLSTSKLWRVYSYNLHYDYLYQNADSSLREHIRPIENPLSKILKIRGVVYDVRQEYYRNTPGEGKMEILIEEGKNNVGVIGQELAEVFPELVNLNKESGYYEVNYIGLISVLIEAMKEQQTQIVSLTEKLDALVAER